MRLADLHLTDNETGFWSARLADNETGRCEIPVNGHTLRLIGELKPDRLPGKYNALRRLNGYQTCGGQHASEKGFQWRAEQHRAVPVAQNGADDRVRVVARARFHLSARL